MTHGPVTETQHTFAARVKILLSRSRAGSGSYRAVQDCVVQRKELSTWHALVKPPIC